VRRPRDGVLADEVGLVAGAGDVHQGPGLLVQFDVVDGVEGSQEGVAGVDEPVVEVEGLRPGHGALLDAAPQ
jgi:hypothetical protein